MFKYLGSSTVVYTMVEIKNFLETCFAGLGLAGYSRVALVQFGLQGGTMGHGAVLFDGRCWIY